jgi:hypothetical protein
MVQGGPEGGVTREAIVADLVALISDMTQDWDLGFSGGIHEETGLVSDLGFQSIDVVMLWARSTSTTAGATSRSRMCSS